MSAAWLFIYPLSGHRVRASSDDYDFLMLSVDKLAYEDMRSNNKAGPLCVYLELAAFLNVINPIEHSRSHGKYQSSWLAGF